MAVLPDISVVQNFCHAPILKKMALFMDEH